MNERRTPSDGKCSPCLWQDELKINAEFSSSHGQSFRKVSKINVRHMEIRQDYTGKFTDLAENDI